MIESKFAKVYVCNFNKRGKNIIRIRSDHDREFENKKFSNFCDLEGILHEVSAPLTPQQNGVVEQKNRNLQEMAKIMLHAKQILLHFWAEAINTACHIHIRIAL